MLPSGQCQSTKSTEKVKVAKSWYKCWVQRWSHSRQSACS